MEKLKSPFAPRDGRPDGPRQPEVRELIDTNSYKGEVGRRACTEDFLDRGYRLTENELSHFLRGTRFFNIYGKCIISEFVGRKVQSLFPGE